MRRVQQTMTMLAKSGIKNVNKPNPIAVAVYFEVVKHGPAGLTRKALPVSLPTWAVLGISFVGGPGLEIIMDKKLKDRLVATMNIMKKQELSNFDILYKNIGKERESRSGIVKGASLRAPKNGDMSPPEPKWSCKSVVFNDSRQNK